jgi:hypothetical protein
LLGMSLLSFSGLHSSSVIHYTNKLSVTPATAPSPDSPRTKTTTGPNTHISRTALPLRKSANTEAPSISD